MNQSNYFKLFSYPQIKLEGFSHITDVAYIRNIGYKHTLVIECRNPGMEKPRIAIYPDINRIERNETLYKLILAYGLDQVHFIYDKTMELYFPTEFKKKPL